MITFDQLTDSGAHFLCLVCLKKRTKLVLCIPDTPRTRICSENCLDIWNKNNVDFIPPETVEVIQNEPELEIKEKAVPIKQVSSPFVINHELFRLV